jgi:glycosyltransferase involved in cell wall biosynthesis
LGGRLRAFQLVRRAKGHGSSYSLNYGVDQALGEYVCFLDDDDLWTDAGHLTRAAGVLAHHRQAGLPVDVYMSNQDAWRDGRRLPDAIWLEALEGRLQARGLLPEHGGAYRVGIPELLQVEGFCHLNCLIVRRGFFLQVGGLDEGIRWENDHDLYLRLLDAAQHLQHHPAFTARHHVPDPKAGTSITTSLGQIERRLWQLRALDKTALFLKSPLLRAYGRRHKGYALKRIAHELAAQGDWATAGYYAREALGVLPTLKWALFTLGCWVRRGFRRR